VGGEKIAAVHCSLSSLFIVFIIHPSSLLSLFPDERAPVGWDDAITQGFGNHPAMALVGAQHMAATAQGAQVRVGVRAELAGFDVVNVCFVERQRPCFFITAIRSLTAPLVALPNPAAGLCPDFSRLSFAGH
jgi:hypothetical protein